MQAVIAVHGGAGRWRRELDERRERILSELANAIHEGLSALATGNAVDAVEAAVRYMESCGEFNAGRGAVLNLRGEVELDAGIMRGDLSFGAVAALRGYWNAVSVARAVMEKTDHVLLVGEGASRLAAALGFERLDKVPERRIKAYHELMQKLRTGELGIWRRNIRWLEAFSYGTVGAVALDKDGLLAAATSTGGIWLKLPGRVGDTPLPGAGLYAEQGAGAASTTGMGEAIAKFLLAKRVCDEMARGSPAAEATARVVDEMSRKIGVGTAGVIAVDPRGNVGYAFNTEIFICGHAHLGAKPAVSIARRQSSR